MVNVSSRPVRILLVEDNPIDVRATLRAAKKLITPISIDVVSNGDQAIEYLESDQHPHPGVVLLDLSLPGRDGHDVLDHMKGDDVLRRVPVIVLTTSASDADVLGAYDRGANAYVNKPSDLAGWQEMLEHVEGFWFVAARLPSS